MKESPGHIRYLTREEIDIPKWDHCIRNAQNSLIYAHSFYLDAMAENWSALVMNDYAIVMPLTWKRKYGIAYLYQPAFTPQLGIFFDQPSMLSDFHPESFLNLLPRYFHFAEIFLNYANAYPALSLHANYILSLNDSYNEISSHYKNGLVKSLKTASRTSFQYIKDYDLKPVLALYQSLYRHRIKVNSKTYERFEKLCLYLQQQKQILVRIITSSYGEVLATALLPRNNERIYLIQSCITPAGRVAGANHFLLDSIIREFAGQRLILDFEGSEIPGIAHFYRSFGAKNQPYFFYRYNHLPWPFQLLKK